MPTPALKNNLDRKKKCQILKYIFSYIDTLSENNKALKISYKLSPLAPSLIESKYPISNYLCKYSFIDISSSTRIIDLQKNKKELWNELRRNHQRGINNIKNNFEIIIYTNESITHEIFDEYRLMHQKAAGRITRPLITFEMMYQWIKDGLAILVASKDKDKNKYSGFEYYGIYKNNAYGFSAANDPEYSHYPIRNQIEWEAILWLKKMGCKYWGEKVIYNPKLHYCYFISFRF